MGVGDEVVDGAAAGGAAHGADEGGAADVAPNSAACRCHPAPAAAVEASSSLTSPLACHLQRFQ